MTTDRNVDNGTEKNKALPFSEIYSALDLSLERHVTNIYMYITQYLRSLSIDLRCALKKSVARHKFTNVFFFLARYLHSRLLFIVYYITKMYYFCRWYVKVFYYTS